MKFPTYQVIATAAVLATATFGMKALQAATTPVASSVVPPQLVAMGNSALARQLQGKPVVVDIYASWCPACKNIAPTLSQLKQQYGNKAHFVVLDVTNRQTTAASMKKAAQLGLTSFLTANKSQTGTVAIIDPASGKVTKQYRNNAELSDYTAVLDRSISKMGQGDAMKKP